MTTYTVVWCKMYKAYMVKCANIETAVEDRDHILSNFLADECYIEGVSKYKIKQLLGENDA